MLVKSRSNFPYKCCVASSYTIYILAVYVFLISMKPSLTLPTKFLRNFTFPSYSTQKLFDDRVKRIQRTRAFSLPNRNTYDYIRESTAANLADRLFDINKEFDFGLEIGCARGDLISSQIDSDKIRVLSQLDNCIGSLTEPNANHPLLMEYNGRYLKMGIFDIAISNLSLHWTNDLEDLFCGINNLLTADSPFIISMFGEFTLCELAASLRDAEMRILGGFSPRVSPFIKLSDLASLFNVAGFQLITVDQDYITVSYPGMLELMQDLGKMGESNCTSGRKSHLRRDVIRLAEEEYRRRYGESNGCVPATFEVIYGIGWTRSLVPD